MKRLEKTSQSKITITLIMILIVVLFACKKGENNDDDNFIKIGVALSLTGDVAAYGERSRKGLMLAVEDINSSGGIDGKRIKVILEDTKSSAKDGIAAIQKLISINNVSVIIGDILSTTTLAMAPIAESNRVILFAPGASNPKMKQAGDYIFRNWLSDEFDGKALAAYIHKEYKTKKIAIIAQRTDYCLGLAEAFEDEFVGLGGKISIKEYFQTNDRDFRTQISKIQQSKIDTVFSSAEARQNGTILRQSYELEYSAQWFMNLTVDTPECANIAGEAREGVIFSTPAFDTTSNKAKIKNFVYAYKSKYNEEPEAAAGHAYDAVNIIAHVMKNSGTKPDSIKQGLYQLKGFPGVTGITSFDKYGDVIKNVFIKKISKAKPIFLTEFNFSE